MSRMCKDGSFVEAALNMKYVLSVTLFAEDNHKKKQHLLYNRSIVFYVAFATHYLLCIAYCVCHAI